ncbi:unnamed protein product, partial [Mesorhabditis belari]|uniref:Major facilitator superfamily (MFS) profile domain-containing protein n=1 Tax=Mesorhabditis belari TaxID=2138241 RepID=A0AAF3F8C2_9BILA
MSTRIHASDTEPPPISFPKDFEEQRPVIPYAFLVLSFLCVCLSFGCSLVISLTLTQIHNYGNGSGGDFYAEWDFRYEDFGSSLINFTTQRRSYLSNPQKEMLKTVDSIGFLILLVPLICFYNKFGFCRGFLLTCAFSIVPSFFLPMFINVQTYVVAIMLRILQGIGWICVVPFIGKLCAFLDVQENKYISWMSFSYMQASAVLVYPISGIIMATELGWHAPHHIVAASLLILLILFMMCHYSEDFKWDVVEKRWTEIFRGHSLGSHLFTMRLPYLSIYQDFRIWVCFLAAAAHFSIIAFSLEVVPTIYVKVLDLEIGWAGFLAALGPAISLPVGYFSIGLFEKLKSLTETNRLRFFHLLSTLFPALLFLVIAFIDPTEKGNLVMGLCTVAVAFSGFAYSGVFRMSQIRSKQFNAFVVVHLLVAQILSFFLTSLVTALISQKNEYTAWRNLFMGETIVLVVSGGLFALCASNEAAAWTSDGYQDTSMKPKRDDPLPQFPL